MNKAHMVFCSSDEWAAACKNWIIPGALANVELGDDVLEIGPGPGRTTDLLREMAPKLTAVEIDKQLAAALAERMSGTNVKVVNADATSLPFPDGRFSAALSFTMLHHVPTVEQQDQLFAEAARVLRNGSVFAGVDSLDTPDFRALHVDDICVPLIPGKLAERLTRAGFSDVKVDPNQYVIQFWAKV
jgi:ubiquinone/menaquinone biosynthesis C-methylase UbiE